MSDPLPCYLRSHRLRAGLTQREVAYLLGHRKASSLSRFEQAARLPNLEAAVVLERVFDVRITELYPDLGAKADALLRERSGRLLRGRVQTPHGRRYLHTLRQRSRP